MIPVSIQIQRSPMQTQKWRFLGFVSAVVGLLCYALSSSFTHLFGHWNFFKFFLYFIFSFIIIFFILFAKVWQLSPSNLFKARFALFFLLATNFYSIVYDKVVTQKPDAYILISCLAFAVMFLSLSKQTHFGFETDLGYYFLICLITLLSKIHMWLFFVGAGSICSFHFCFYSSSDATPDRGIPEPQLSPSSSDATPDSGIPEPQLFPSSSDATPDSGIPELQDLLEIRVDSQGVNTSSSVQVDSQHVNTNGAIQVDSQHVNTNGAIQVDSQHVNTNGAIQVDSIHVNTNGAIQVDSQHVHTNVTLIMQLLIQFEACISALQKEEGSILSQVWNYVKDKVDSSFNYKVALDENLLIDLLPSETINNLEETVKLMVAAGFEKKCRKRYIKCRRVFLQKCIPRLDLDFSGFNSRKYFPSAVDKWKRASYIALRILFPCERKLCNHIFGSFSSADLSFMEVCREFTIELMNFPNSLTTERCSSNYLKNCLRVLHILGDFIPEYESLFYGDASLINEVKESWKRLGEAIRVFVGELEQDIFRDMEQKSVPNGGIDPITISVFEKIFLPQFPMVGDRKRTSSVYVHMARSMELLDRNLESKSQNYTDPALSYVFMMNNCKHIAEIVEDRARRGMTTILADWIKKHNTKFQQNFEDYHRTWDKVLDILKLGSNESAESMKEKLKLFNMKFKEICRVQSGWFVLDEHLRVQIKKSIETLLFPAYEKFIWRFLGNHASEYIEYGMYDMEALLNDLFRGTGSKIKSRKNPLGILKELHMKPEAALSSQ